MRTTPKPLPSGKRRSGRDAVATVLPELLTKLTVTFVDVSIKAPFRQ
ncbi:hypothetical protein OAP76_00850 [Alphaproteobacteria bacterium]|nr:hypothetical protein [Alphaproteobacteria bacterium]